MAVNCWIWLKMDGNGWKLLKMAQTAGKGQKLFEMAVIGLKWMEWLGMDRLGINNILVKSENLGILICGKSE